MSQHHYRLIGLAMTSNQKKVFSNACSDDKNFLVSFIEIPSLRRDTTSQEICVNRQMHGRPENILPLLSIGGRGVKIMYYKKQQCNIRNEYLVNICHL